MVTLRHSGSAESALTVEFGAAPTIACIFEAEASPRLLVPRTLEERRRVFLSLSPQFRAWLLALDVWTPEEREELADA